MEDIIKKKKRNFILIIFIVIASIVLLGIILGVIDFTRAKLGKKPLFAPFKTGNTNYGIDIAYSSKSIVSSNEDSKDVALPSKTNRVYNGFGYNVSTCDIEGNNYVFRLGQKEEQENCFTTLSCTDTQEDVSHIYYTFDFFEDKLYRLITFSSVNINSSSEGEKLIEDYKKIDDIYGVNILIEKIDDTLYGITNTYNLVNMSKSDINNVSLKGSIKLENILKLNKKEITDKYIKTMTCTEY